MLSFSLSPRATWNACAAFLASVPLQAAEPMRVVFQNGRSIQLSSLAASGGKLVTTTAGDGYTQGQTIALESIDHVYGDEPSGIKPAVALVLMGKPAEAQKLLEPILAAQEVTAKIAGNYWLTPARAALVAYALQGNSAKVTAIGKEISDATPEPGADPFVMLGRALLLPPTTPVKEREDALKELISDQLPSELCAYASYFQGELLRDQKRSADAAEAAKQDQALLDCYLAVPCLYPTGGMVLNGAAELKAAGILADMGRREEALALLNSSVRHAVGTLLVPEAKKRLDSLK
jgi:tetratricopeptide (TPR) repeat protein